jgi:hypothetical protein
MDWDVALGIVLRDFIRDYQTLITGFMAIAAAVIAVKPVWRQLRQTAVQTNLNLREFLFDRISIIAGRQRWFADSLGKFQSDVLVRLYEMERDGKGMNVPWAFDQAQAAGGLLAAVRQKQEEHRDPPSIEAAIAAAIGTLEALENALDAIHRPDSSQSDEDYTISDEDWKKMGNAARDAEKQIHAVADRFSSAVKHLDDMINAELRSLRRRVRDIDEALHRSRPDVHLME